jgi:hypothetical protein
MGISVKVGIDGQKNITTMIFEIYVLDTSVWTKTNPVGRARLQMTYVIASKDDYLQCRTSATTMGEMPQSPMHTYSPSHHTVFGPMVCIQLATLPIRTLHTLLSSIPMSCVPYRQHNFYH